jgi:hypothetical protein
LFPRRKNSEGKALEPRPNELNALASDRKRLQEYRVRLSDISWLMRLLAEKIARMSNKEDDCTGRFWEGRFKCQPLLDEAALLACATYVDLNPVRAGLAATPESSDFTSIQDRIAAETAARRLDRKSTSASPPRRDSWLSPVALEDLGMPGPDPSRSGHRASDKGFLPMSLDAYLSLVDWTGRHLARGKTGKIPASCEPILKRVGLDGEVWCELVRDFRHLFRRVVGNRTSLIQSATARGLQHHQSSGGTTLLSSVS